MNRVDSFLVITAFVIFIASGYIPNVVYIYGFTNMFVPFLLFISVLAAMSYSRVGSICLALAYVSLFVEFRKRVMARQPDAEPVEYKKQMESAPVIVPSEVHPAHLEPSDDVVVYRPQEEQTETFETVGKSINMKHAMESESLPQNTEKFLISHGLV